MQLLRSISQLHLAPRDGAITIGAFDGIHLGHQALIARTRELATSLNKPVGLLTFEPLPREFLQAQEPPARLTSLRERCALFSAHGIDFLVVLPFNQRLRGLSGEDFIQLLTRDLQVAAVVVGHDFKFGRGGQMNAGALQQAAQREGFQLEVLPPVCVGDERVSSSAVRVALAAGDFAKAQLLLGRPYAMCGRVRRGEQLGRALGFPTANLRVARRRSPLQGIFAVQVLLEEGQRWPAVASLGTRPTVNGGEMLLEVHLFDFAADLYGRNLRVEFVAKLRDEQRFATLDDLVAQMQVDAAQARRILHCPRS